MKELEEKKELKELKELKEVRCITCGALLCELYGRLIIRCKRCKEWNHIEIDRDVREKVKIEKE